MSNAILQVQALFAHSNSRSYLYLSCRSLECLNTLKMQDLGFKIKKACTNKGFIDNNKLRNSILRGYAAIAVVVSLIFSSKAVKARA